MGLPAETTRRRFTVEEYHRMADAGVFAPRDRLELIDGEILEVTPIGARHLAAVLRLNQALQQAFAGQALISPQLPLVLDDYSEPQPDLALLAIRGDFYASGLPSAPDALLVVEVVVEVSDTSLRYDRELKLPRYARAGVPEVWILDLAGRRLHVYREPADDRYAVDLALGGGDAVEVAAFPATRFLVSDLLG
jgi:Uma2 family endonuclease